MTAATTLEVEELDGDGAADALAATLRRIVAAEADQFVLAAHWVDLHAPEVVEGALAVLPGAVPPGAEKAVRAGAAGTPLMEEFAPAELAALLGMSTQAGAMLVADAVNVRHRHRLLWARLVAGQVRVWVARKVARRCATAGLTAAQAMWVDAETTPFATTLTPGRFLALVDAKIIAADPAAAEERARAEALRQFARAGQVDEHGMRTFVARAVAGDVSYLVAVLERIAGVLALQGDQRPLDARTATALRLLANPARALALLTQATLDDTQADDTEPGDTQAGDTEAGDTGPRPSAAAGEEEGEFTGLLSGRLPERFSEYPEDRPELVGTDGELVDWMVDAQGRRLPGTPLRGDLVPLPVPDRGDPPFQAHGPAIGQPAIGQPVIGQPVIGGGGSSGPLEEALDPALLGAVLAALEAFDATRWDPVTVLHVHTSVETLVGGQGVVRVEDVGPLVAAAAQAWLADRPGALTIRPVLDTRAVAPVDRYEFTAAMKEAIAARFPVEVFPYGTVCTRRGDHDHATPYDPDGPPGQTNLDTCTPLGRRHHRIKTHGRWVLRITEPGTFWWRSPHGHWFRVDRHGTHRHGRDTTLDTNLLAARLTGGSD